MPELQQHFPEAIPLSQLEQKIITALTDKEFTFSQTIWGTSICSDEVNNSLNAFNDLFAGPGPFRFGGISGLPFTGTTGMKAFASHIPDEGGAFILFGPHIGYSGEGSIGEINREAQTALSTCCGSVVAALDTVKSNQQPEGFEQGDYQQARVIKVLDQSSELILEKENELISATEVVLNQIKEELYQAIDSAKDVIGGKPIFLIGGIIINTDWNKEDYFEVRYTELIGDF